MRSPLKYALALALLAPLGLTACGGDDTKKSTDMAVSSGDASASADAAQIPHGDKACTTILFTAQKCTGDVPACVKAAVEDGTIMAQSEFQALLTCGYTHCVGKTFDFGTGSDDAGISGCTDAKDVSAGCQKCVSSEATGADCKAEFSACVNGK